MVKKNEWKALQNKEETQIGKKRSMIKTSIKDGTLPFATAWSGLVNIVLPELSQTKLRAV